ncbi:hypothetical protein JRQ81_006509 [Phrynocephalus forsythii]|uniref:Uncharacterized protein n=1 Tax=Phrynocephalus forsythii TaxID=171643 RepID=A0A9Q1AUP8_9SAUR|nr:hypothetical protein JRQ81_006509 [Phrynocephalus forsythii]
MVELFCLAHEPESRGDRGALEANPANKCRSSSPGKRIPVLSDAILGCRHQPALAKTPGTDQMGSEKQLQAATTRISARSPLGKEEEEMKSKGPSLGRLQSKNMAHLYVSLLSLLSTNPLASIFPCQMEGSEHLVGMEAHGAGYF